MNPVCSLKLKFGEVPPEAGRRSSDEPSARFHGAGPPFAHVRLWRL